MTFQDLDENVDPFITATMVMGNGSPFLPLAIITGAMVFQPGISQLVGSGRVPIFDFPFAVILGNADNRISRVEVTKWADRDDFRSVAPSRLEFFEVFSPPFLVDESSSRLLGTIP